MPHIEVICHKNFIFEHVNDQLRFRDRLVEEVAKNLGCSELGGELKPSDIMVSFTWQGDLDVMHEDILIKITANHFTGRTLNSKERLEKIVTAMKDWNFHLKKREGEDSVNIAFWLLLHRAEFTILSI